MKNLKYTIFSLSLIFLGLTACVKEDYRIGNKDAEDLTEVFFAASSEGKLYEMDPDEPQEIEFDLERVSTEGELEVPIVIKSGDKTLFNIPEKVSFSAGSKKASFKVSFPAIELSKEYKLAIGIEDPKFKSNYISEKTVIDFSVLKIKWNKLSTDSKKGTYREGLLSDVFGVGKYPTTQLEIYERDDKRGFYRIEDFYSDAYLRDLFDETGKMKDGKTRFFIDASDPKKVFFRSQSLGCELNSGFGDTHILLNVPECGLPNGNAYGVLEDGVITFPKGGVILRLDGLKRNFPSNLQETFAIALPGKNIPDYSLSVVPGACSAGKIPVEIKRGANVEKVKYVVLEGRVNPLDLKGKAKEILSGNLASTEKTEASFNTEITQDATGEYTFFAVGTKKTKDGKKDTVANMAYAYVYYLKNGDSKPIELNKGLFVTDEAAGEGYTSKNSLKFYLNSGKNIKELAYIIVKKSDYDAKTDDFKKVVKSKSVSADILKKINKNGISEFVKKSKKIEGKALKEEDVVPSTAYVLLIYASNGYTEEFITVEATTNS